MDGLGGWAGRGEEIRSRRGLACRIRGLSPVLRSSLACTSARRSRRPQPPHRGRQDGRGKERVTLVCSASQAATNSSQPPKYMCRRLFIVGETVTYVEQRMPDLV